MGYKNGEEHLSMALMHLEHAMRKTRVIETDEYRNKGEDREDRGRFLQLCMKSEKPISQVQYH